MKRIFLICCMFTCTNLYAVGMCVPDITGAKVGLTFDDTGDGNRGKFRLGRGNQVFIRGESHCSVSKVWPADNWETLGQHCFCRLTHVMAPNGYLAPVKNTSWIYDQYYGTADGQRCLTICPSYCTHFSSIYFRTMMTARMGD